MLPVNEKHVESAAEPGIASHFTKGRGGLAKPCWEAFARYSPPCRGVHAAAKKKIGPRTNRGPILESFQILSPLSEADLWGSRLSYAVAEAPRNTRPVVPMGSKPVIMLSCQPVPVWRWNRA